METKKDFILENIKDIMKNKSIKVETVSTGIGISKGEFSKILSGERENYFKHLPQIAHSLGVSFHELVTPKSVVQNNHGEVKENSIGNASNTQIRHHGNVDLYEKF
jgi:transcriptional regulator with XRE-family HTH domain